MRLVIFGANGQLGQSLQRRSNHYPQHEYVFLSRSECDLSLSGQAFEAVLSRRPDCVINASAYTAVDLAETQADLAHRINADAVAEMAKATSKLGIPFIHFSTDYVFDGTKPSAYLEDDPVAPLGIYGESKHAGEQGVIDHCDNYLIFRTAWVYSAFGRNFVKTMLRLMAQKEVLSVVADQRGCPTSAHDLAEAVFRILPDFDSSDYEGFGVYHLVGADAMSWFDFAVLIQQVAIEQAGEEWAGAKCLIKPIPTKDYPTPAARPANSVLSCDKFNEKFGFGLPPCRESLKSCVAEILANGSENG